MNYNCLIGVRPLPHPEMWSHLGYMQKIATSKIKKTVCYFQWLDELSSVYCQQNTYRVLHNNYQLMLQVQDCNSIAIAIDHTLFGTQVQEAVSLHKKWFLELLERTPRTLGMLQPKEAEGLLSVHTTTSISQLTLSEAKPTVASQSEALQHTVILQTIQYRLSFPLLWQASRLDMKH